MVLPLYQKDSCPRSAHKKSLFEKRMTYGEIKR
jgi:hypothetical protein